MEFHRFSPFPQGVSLLVEQLKWCGSLSPYETTNPALPETQPEFNPEDHGIRLKTQFIIKSEITMNEPLCYRYLPIRTTFDAGREGARYMATSSRKASILVLSCSVSEAS